MRQSRFSGAALLLVAVLGRAAATAAARPVGAQAPEAARVGDGRHVLDAHPTDNADGVYCDAAGQPRPKGEPVRACPVP